MNTNITINRILKYVCLIGLFLVLFIPLSAPYNATVGQTGSLLIPKVPFFNSMDMFFPFITGKNFLFRLIVEVIFGAWLILAVTNPAYRPRKSWLLWILSGFVIVIAFADATGVYPFKSFWSNYERMEGFITLAHAFAYFLVISAILNTEKLWNRFWNTSIGASLILVLYGILQLRGIADVHQGDRLDASLGNSAYLAMYMLFHIFLVLFIIANKRWTLFSFGRPQGRVQKTIIGGVIILLETIILFNTGTRGAILGLIGGLALAALLVAIFDRTHKKTRQAAGVTILCLIIVVLGFIAVKDKAFVKNNKVLNRFATISLNDPTTQSRIILWQMGLEGFKERPILGWGQENFNYVFNKYYDPRLYNVEQWYDRTHNVIFDWLIAGGILGLGGYLAFFGAIIWFIWKGNGDAEDMSVIEKSILTGFLAAYFIHNFFVFDNLISYIMYFSLAGYIYSRRTYLAVHVPHEHRNNQIIAPVTLVAAAFIIYFLNVPAIKANTTLIKAITPDPTNLAANITYFNQALAEKSYGDPEIREQIINLTDNVIAAAQQNPTLGQAAGDFMNLMVKEYKNQLVLTPNDARYYILPASTLSHAGQYPDAIALLQKGLVLTPKKQTVMFELAAAYIGNNEADKGLPLLKTAYELNKNNKFAQGMYAAGAIYAKQDALANTLLKDFTPLEVAQNDQIMRSYYVTKQYQKIVELWKVRVADKNDVEGHVSLAAAYLLIKDPKNAIAELEKAQKIDPNFKTQGDQYIQGIKDGTIK